MVRPGTVQFHKQDEQQGRNKSQAMFAQVVQVYYITNSQGVGRSWRHLFRQRKLKRHHQVRDEAGAQAPPQAIAEQSKAESQLEKCTSAKFGEIGDWATKLKENPLGTLTALAHLTHSLFWALKIRPKCFWPGPQSCKGRLPSHHCCTPQRSQDRFCLTSGDHILPQSYKLDFPGVFAPIYFIPEMHIPLD